ncbi:hypothetical protein [Microbulbifer sp. SAOS-129_SWC]|uniref:hypothetical protein n=1 Tax=Microbulbifer sp. SAOS-129_SWC TaxID=3145235 RepID=UPI003216217A
MRIAILFTILLSSTCIAFELKDSVSTRFGTVDIYFDESSGREEQNIEDSKDGLSPIYFVDYDSLIGTWQLGDADVILVRTPQGNSCPGLFVIYEVKPKFISKTEEFGTCYDADLEVEKNNSHLIMKMPKSYYERTIVSFIFKNGKVEKM